MRAVAAKTVPLPHRTEVANLIQVSKGYGHRDRYVPVLSDVSLAVSAGEILGITGESGSGKSTLLRVLAGLESCDAGLVRLGGIDIWAQTKKGPALPRPGFVMPIFQDPIASLDQRWEIWRSITEPLCVRARLRAEERRDRTRQELAKVGLAHLDVTALPGELSVGQCQRAAIVRALIAKPALVIADEPTASLDVTTAAGITRLLRRAADDGAALVVVSHDRERLEVLADRVLHFQKGRLREGRDLGDTASQVSRTSAGGTEASRSNPRP